MLYFVCEVPTFTTTMYWLGFFPEFWQKRTGFSCLETLLEQLDM